MSKRSADDVPNLQTPYNYHRALVWTAVMASLTHLDPAFSSVFAIQAVNEPIMDATQTPGYGSCAATFPSQCLAHLWSEPRTVQKNFVQTIRAVELALGITVPGVAPLAHGAANFTVALNNTAHAGAFNADVAAALLDAVPILLWAAEELALGAALTTFLGLDRTPLTTKFVALHFPETTAEDISQLHGRQLAVQRSA
jgi:hypothetical protein